MSADDEEHPAGQGEMTHRELARSVGRLRALIREYLCRQLVTGIPSESEVGNIWIRECGKGRGHSLERALGADGTR